MARKITTTHYAPITQNDEIARKFSLLRQSLELFLRAKNKYWSNGA